MIDLNDPELIESLNYLTVPETEKNKALKQKYDPALNVLAQNDREGYIPVTIFTEDPKKGCLIVKTRKSELVTCLKENTLPMNPPSLEFVEDMAVLDKLNPATLLHNLRERYNASIIYTYSGLFCVALNPYMDLPLYSRKLAEYYKDKEKCEVAPHLYYIAGNALTCLKRDRKNQSILIT